MFQTLNYLGSNSAKLFIAHPLEFILFQPAIEVCVQNLGDYAEMASEKEAVQYFDQPVLLWLFGFNLHQNLGLNSSILTLIFLILTNFDSYQTLILFHISTLKNLTKGTLSTNLIDYITVVYLLTNMHLVTSVTL